jgi:predicted translin family RNA/ssDNA-binding protein
VNKYDFIDHVGKLRRLVEYEAFKENLESLPEFLEMVEKV